MVTYLSTHFVMELIALSAASGAHHNMAPVHLSYSPGCLLPLASLSSANMSASSALHAGHAAPAKKAAAHRIPQYGSLFSCGYLFFTLVFFFLFVETRFTSFSFGFTRCSLPWSLCNLAAAAASASSVEPAVKRCHKRVSECAWD